MDRKSLEKEYRKLAKQADQRLVRLESYKHDKGFKTATLWAYPKAIHAIERWSGEGATRFNTKPPENDIDLMKKIADIKEFLASPSSTKKGIIGIYKKKANTLNENYGTNFTWQELAEFFEDGGAWEQLREADYGSDTILTAIGSYKQDKTKIEKAIKDKVDAVTRYDPGDDPEQIRAILKAKGYDKTTIDSIIKVTKGQASFEDTVRAADKLGTYLPGNKQEQRDMKNIAFQGGIDWESIMGS